MCQRCLQTQGAVLAGDEDLEVLAKWGQGQRNAEGFFESL